MKDGDPHYESFYISGNNIKTKFSTSFLKKSCTFVTGYGLKNIGFASYFSSMSAGSVFRVPSVPSKNCSIFL